MINNLLLTSAQPGSAAADYIEDYFSTSLYTANGAQSFFFSGAPPLSSTAAWSTNLVSAATSAGGDGDSGTAVDSSGNYYVAGEYDNDTTRGMSVTKFNSSGVTQWTRTIYQASTYSCGGVAVDSSGNVHVVGSAQDATRTYGLLVKYNSSGTLQWQRKIYEGFSRLRKVVVDSSSNIFVVGFAAASGTGSNYLLLAKYNSSGTLQWTATSRNTSGGSTGWDLALDSSGNIYVTSDYVDINGAWLYTAKYNASGVLQWQRRLQQNGGYGYGYGIAVDSSNDVYVCGYVTSGSQSTHAATLVKYNSSGTKQWERHLNSGYASYFFSVCVDSSGNICAAGNSSPGQDSGLIASYSPSGTLLWKRQISTTATQRTIVRGISANSSGNIYLSGATTNDSSIKSLFCLKMKSDGSSSSGTAFLTMFASPIAEVTRTISESAGNATTSTTPTSEAGTATEGPSLTTSFASQPEVISASGLVWFKSRSGATDHALYDTVRGTEKDLASNLTTGQTTQSTGVVSFGASGVLFGSLAKLNTSSAIYAAWTFREKEKFFDVVTYTGNGANRTISHNLGAVPGMIIIKRTDTTGAWAVYHRSLANTQYVLLNSYAPVATGTTYWNSTTATSTVFSLGTATDVNANGGTYVAYIFAHNAGGFGLTSSDNVISCGSFVYTAGVSGNLAVTLGWEPQFIIYKNTSSNSSWCMHDNVRGFPVTPENTSNLQPDGTTPEGTNFPRLYPTSTGFVAPSSTTTDGTYIYIAIRRGPMAVPTDATKVFMPTVYTGTNVNNRLINTTIAPDMVWIRQRNSTTFSGMAIGDRLRGQPYLPTGNNSSQVTSATAFDQQIVSATEYGTAFSSMTGVWVGTDAAAQFNVSGTANNQVIEAFKRAPGFFDVVTYTGTGVNRTVSHNLNAVPELMIVRTVTSNNWAVYSSSAGTIDDYFFLNSNSSISSGGGSALWNNTLPTSSVFSVGISPLSNQSGSGVVAYLFATCPGVSKVGSYTGTGTTKQVDCGFTSGARLVLIKRTDSTGDWYIYDTARGIVAGNDPYILLNSTAAEVTNTDYVDAYSAGFELSSTAPAGLNANGGTYIFLAIA